MRRRTLVASLLAVPAAATLASSPASAGHALFPEVIDLPDGWGPEGIVLHGTDFYVSSLLTGGIYKGSLITGRGSALVPQGPGSQAVGLELDWRGRIWAAGGGGGGATVYDRQSGAALAHYDFGGSFVNDAIALPHGVYFTDSVQPVLFYVPFGAGGRLPAPPSFKTVSLTGGLSEEGAFNNGVEVLPDGKLLIVQMLAGRLFTYDPHTRAVAQVNLGGASVFGGDGVVRRGSTVYIVRNMSNIISKFELNASFTSATLIEEITDARLAVPATLDLFGPYLYAVNARFDVEPTPQTSYNILRLAA